MPLTEREFSDYCNRPAQNCDNYPDCAHCPWAKEAVELKRKALEEGMKEE